MKNKLSKAKEKRLTLLLITLVFMLGSIFFAGYTFAIEELFLFRISMFIYVVASLFHTYWFKRGLFAQLSFIATIVVIFVIMTSNIIYSPRFTFQFSQKPAIELEKNFFNGSVPLACVQYDNNAISCVPVVFLQNESLNENFRIPCYEKVTDEGLCSYNPNEGLFNCDFTIFKKQGG